MDYPGHVIREGETDRSIVQAIQAQLNAAGCGPLDGKGAFGPKTKASVKLFQARHVDSKGNPLKGRGSRTTYLGSALRCDDGSDLHRAPLGVPCRRSLQSCIASGSHGETHELEQWS